MAAWVSHQRLDNGDIHLRWPDVQQLLGRPYRGDDADDRRIVESCGAMSACPNGSRTRRVTRTGSAGT